MVFNRLCARAALPANRIIGITKRTYSCKIKDNILSFYKSSVYHLKDKGSMFDNNTKDLILSVIVKHGALVLLKNVGNIQKVQRHMTYMMPEPSQ